jgi:hypothetical protein
VSGVLVEAGARRWRVLGGQAPREAARLQAILSAQLRDELTGAPPLAAIDASTETRGMGARASPSGRIGLVGRPAVLFPDPWPAPAPSAAIRIETRDHFPLSLATELDPQPDMPDRYAPTALGDFDLHRRPTTFSGRVVSRLTGPVAGADVAVTLYWQAFADIAGAGLAADALSLWSGVYADRAAGATVQRRTFNLPDSKLLNAVAQAGDTQLLLSDRQSLLVGRPLAIEPGDPEREEYIGIAAIDTTLSADQPALVTLEHPLRRAHAAGTTVARTTVASSGAPKTLDRDARGGDVSIYLSDLAGILPTHRIVEISGGGPGLAPEYHSFARWRATTGPDGRFRLPPIHRAAHVEIEALGVPGASPIRATLNAPGDALADILFG